jgi:putative ABC transport system ATP-binding protein
MAESKINSDNGKSISQNTSLSTATIVAKEVEMVVYSGQQPLHLLKQIDLKIQKGDIQLLMGPSGSGKTTLLSVLAGLLTPTAGNVQLLGEEITTMSRRQLTQFRRRHIGFDGD